MTYLHFDQGLGESGEPTGFGQSAGHGPEFVSPDWGTPLAPLATQPTAIPAPQQLGSPRPLVTPAPLPSPQPMTYPGAVPPSGSAIPTWPAVPPATVDGGDLAFTTSGYSAAFLGVPVPTDARSPHQGAAAQNRVPPALWIVAACANGVIMVFILIGLVIDLSGSGWDRDLSVLAILVGMVLICGGTMVMFIHEAARR